ncbi:MAG: ATP-binding cassette domain-containing protein [Kiritimatiellae bacterium]|nr:ATP-binding cassette domain-containing protein [Kiritimatiellia bacterium]
MIVQVDNLRFAYGRQTVLEDVSFGIEAGELVAVLGENGSGKTTLLKIIGRLLKPGAGSVRIDGLPVADMSRREAARRIGYMPQAQQAVHCTVFEAVLLGRKARKDGEPNRDDSRKVEEVLRLVRLDHLAMRPTHQLSGGELQKVILGRALAQEPRVLLLDEPISHLDPVNQLEVMSLLHEVTKGTNVASLLVTHDLNSALRFADRFIMLKDGNVLAQGGRAAITPAAIRATYGIDCLIEEVAGVPVLVPLLREVRDHRHIHTHTHSHRHAHDHAHGAEHHTHPHAHTHSHPHAHSHAHEVDGHVYDHPHPDAHGEHEHEHPAHEREPHVHEHTNNTEARHESDGP